ncbi:hypothetical protein ACH4GM_27230 [Streptomyces coeruleorubidus]|uniref:hypothetical protein n=1 Tax=Streptomyces coeruleorubidus TaxID=116188 RepID=UPI00378DAA9A
MNPIGAGPEYTPVYGGKLLPRTPGQAFATGRFNQVPVLQGINRHESRAGVYGLELAKQTSGGGLGERVQDLPGCGDGTLVTLMAHGFDGVSGVPKST